MNEQKINATIDRVQDQLSSPSAETRNALHACRLNHPLSSGDRESDFYNAAFVLSGQCLPSVVKEFQLIGYQLRIEQ
jgi:hypothetical protein